MPLSAAERGSVLSLFGGGEGPLSAEESAALAFRAAIAATPMSGTDMPPPLCSSNF